MFALLSKVIIYPCCLPCINGLVERESISIPKLEGGKNLHVVDVAVWKSIEHILYTRYPLSNQLRVNQSAPDREKTEERLTKARKERIRERERDGGDKILYQINQRKKKTGGKKWRKGGYEAKSKIEEFGQWDLPHGTFHFLFLVFLTLSFHKFKRRTE